MPQYSRSQILSPRAIIIIIIIIIIAYTSQIFTITKLASR
jgi:hypothetical protein